MSHPILCGGRSEHDDGATGRSQAKRRDDGRGMVGRDAVKRDVSKMISSWEQ